MPLLKARIDITPLIGDLSAAFMQASSRAEA